MRLPGGASTYVSVPINCLILVHYRRASQDFRIHRSPTPSSETGDGTPGNFQRLPILVIVYFYFHTFRLIVAFTYTTYRSHAAEPQPNFEFWILNPSSTLFSVKSCKNGGLSWSPTQISALQPASQFYFLLHNDIFQRIVFYPQGGIDGFLIQIRFGSVAHMDTFSLLGVKRCHYSVVRWEYIPHALPGVV